MASAPKYPPEWLDRVPAVVFACLRHGELRIVVHPGVGLVDGGVPRDVPVDLIPLELRMPNTPLWLKLDEKMNIFQVWRRETHSHDMTLTQTIHGAILGSVVGDALGLPYEALSARRGRRLFGPPDRYHFLLGRGMMSDDGEHACMVAQSLAQAGGDVKRFRKALAWKMRWWLLGAPAGIGLATLRATIRLWIGFPATRSGVFSAGNGPAMRSVTLGAAIEDPETLRRFVEASTRITHTDPKAYHGALAVAVAARSAIQREGGSDFLARVRAVLNDSGARELIELLERAVASVESGEATVGFANSLGAAGGVSGYMYQTVPVAIHAWLRHSDSYADAVRAVIECGGDTDSVASITGAIVGSAVGPDGIPKSWRDGLLEWPRSTNWIARLAGCAAESIDCGKPVASPRVGPFVILRNVVFLLAVVIHVARRMLPPY